MQSSASLYALATQANERPGFWARTATSNAAAETRPVSRPSREGRPPCRARRFAANRRGILALVALASSVTLAPGRARADEPVRSTRSAPLDSEFEARRAAEDLRRLDVFLHSQAEKARKSVPWLGATSIALGAIAIGAGTGLTLREVSVPGFVVIGQGVAAVAGGSLLLLYRNEPFAELESALESERRAGRSDAPLLQKTLSHWDRLAADARSRRHVWGTTSTVVGSLLTVGAAVVATPSSSTLGMTNREQALTTSVLISAGIATASAGIVTILLESPIEQTRNAFANPDSKTPSSEGSLLQRLRFGVGPAVAARGAFGTLGVSF